MWDDGGKVAEERIFGGLRSNSISTNPRATHQEHGGATQGILGRIGFFMRQLEQVDSPCGERRP
jgi:hypothetical protein